MTRTFAGITYGGRADTIEAVVAGCKANGAGVAVWRNAPSPARLAARRLDHGDGLNHGHTRAVAEMMRYADRAGHTHYLLCCDDAVCAPGYVEAAQRVMARDPRIACVCTPQMNVGPFPELSAACTPLAPDGRRAREGYILECAFVACVFRLEAMADIGFVDTRFFFHSFDTDTCWTLWASGWRVYQLGTELVEHVHHAEGRNARDLLDPWAGEQFRRQDCWRLWEKWSHADWRRIARLAPYLHHYCVGKHGMDRLWTAERFAEVRHLVR